MTRAADAALRHYLSAFLAASIGALLVDAVLQLSLEAVTVTGFGDRAPWWVTGHLVERGRWVAFAALLWWLAPGWVGDDVAGQLTGAGDRSEAWRVVGTAVIAIPLLWLLATWAITALRFTLLGSWTTDGRVFLAAEYYRGVLVDYVPWLMAGLIVQGMRKHLE